MDTSIALLIFNRPDTTARVFAAIAAAAPRRLFVIADGPRPDHPTDQERCAATRAVTEQISWDCEVVRIYAETDLGCGVCPATGLNTVFEHVEACIILEDDFVPHPSFFPFCTELLARYRDDERVAMVSGNNFLLGRYAITASYCFNYYAGMWGWATWRRAWRHHQMTLESWPQLRDEGRLREILLAPGMVAYWSHIFDGIHAQAGARDVWDAQWYAAMWQRRSLAITPRVNLVSNIGFRADATHTTGEGRLGHLPALELGAPLTHPRTLVRDRTADRIAMRNALPHLFGLEPQERLARSLPTSVRTGLLWFYQQLRLRSSFGLKRPGRRDVERHI